ncbi:uncharacterized protein LOC119338137 [Triticum dicoccoides]|uniref:uncharacterized protein LOC119338137 n=1 Tax=Triticum dicoccoides TaxID=85692 RepID=UPI000E7C410E|nr:uncharacterized protein LOC119338137 [Triticum dicoccoides]XP_044432043.1 uncharacterized protein LOC123157921 [Triticum aestivum]
MMDEQRVRVFPTTAKTASTKAATDLNSEHQVYCLSWVVIVAVVFVLDNLQPPLFTSNSPASHQGLPPVSLDRRTAAVVYLAPCHDSTGIKLFLTGQPPPSTSAS